MITCVYITLTLQPRFSFTFQAYVLFNTNIFIIQTPIKNCHIVVCKLLKTRFFTYKTASVLF